MVRLAMVLLAIASSGARGACPMGEKGTLPDYHPTLESRRLRQEQGRALSEIDFAAVKTDLAVVMTAPQDFWPPDFGNYGPFFIRLAWHCAGSYRTSDGRGGCDGGRIRFAPEIDWPDNANLNYALELLKPTKEKYGNGLSWGDLIILAGDTAIETMGGETLGFCGGRIDDADGVDSQPLGPSVEQETLYPCVEDDAGACQAPLGAVEVGLIYVNPAGPIDDETPEASAPQVREVFGRMGMNDRETVALVGGGHAFGKAHVNTSGFELVWTTRPTEWSKDYFVSLRDTPAWENFTGPGGNIQWRVQGTASNIGMFTSDLALAVDASFKEIVDEFAADLASLTEAFKMAWYKLVTRDMGPHSRCVGNLVPAAQPWQSPLPAPPAKNADFAAAAAKVKEWLDTNEADGGPRTQGLIRLAWNCMSTYRVTDHSGGCNGARIMLSPEKDWMINNGLQQERNLVAEIKGDFQDLTIADMIVLAGNVAIKHKGGPEIKFCGGRSDAVNGNGSLHLDEVGDIGEAEDVAVIRNWMRIKGFTERELVVLIAAGRSLGVDFLLHKLAAASEPQLTNNYFGLLLDNPWEEYSDGGKKRYRVANVSLIMLPSDIALKSDDAFKAIMQEYKGNTALFVTDLSDAWTRLQNVDRFDGPTGNLCEARDDATSTTSQDGQDSSGAWALTTFVGSVFLAAFSF